VTIEARGIAELSRAIPVAGLAALLVVATLGEGGAEATSLLVWHTLLVAFVIVELVLAESEKPTWRLATGPLAGFFVFFGVALIGAARAPYGFAAWLYLLELAAFAAIVWLASRRGSDLLSIVATPLMLVAAVQSVLFLVQRYVLGQARPAGTFLNPNHLAGWLVAVMLLALGPPLLQGRAGRRAFSRLALLGAPVVVAMVHAASRGALLGLGAGLLALLIMSWKRLPRRWRNVAVASGLVIVVGAGVGLALRFRQTDPFRYQRLKIWRASLGVVADDPWFGSGPRQFAYAAKNHQFPDGDGPLRHDRGFRVTHSDWLRVPCELGLPGAVVLLLTIGTLVRCVRRRRRRVDSPDSSVLAIAPLIALGVQASVDNLSTRPALYLLAGALLGNLLTTRDDRGRFRPWPSRWLLSLLLLFVFVIGDLAPYLAWRDVRGLPRGRLAAEQSIRLERALRRNRVHPDFWSRRAEHLAGSGSDWGIEGYTEAREAAERAVRLQPAGPEFHRVLARVESLACRTLFQDAGTRQRASAAFERAEDLDRYDPFIPLERAGFLLDTGDPTAAARAAERALELEPESVLPRLMLADALLESEARDGVRRAEELLEEAREKAVRWSAWAETGQYTRDLLVLDWGALRRIDEKLARRRERDH
jgi:O-antigen ligase